MKVTGDPPVTARTSSGPGPSPWVSIIRHEPTLSLFRDGIRVLALDQ